MDKTQIFLGEKLLAEVDENKTVTILTEQRKAKENITIYFGASGTIHYNGVTTSIRAGQTVILECADKILLTNVVVKTALQLDAPIIHIHNNALSSPIIYIYDEELGYTTALLGAALLDSAMLGFSY